MGAKSIRGPSPRAPMPGRRAFLESAVGVSAGAATFGLVLLAPSEVSQAAALTKEQRDRMTPAQVLEALQRGNERFRTGKMQAHDYLAQKRATIEGQYPAAAILSCVDSRAPAE